MDNPAIWSSGKHIPYLSSEVNWISFPHAIALAWKFLRSRQTPFGRPVDPEVKTIDSNKFLFLESIGTPHPLDELTNSSKK